MVVIIALLGLLQAQANGEQGFVGPQPVPDNEVQIAYVTATYAPSPVRIHLPSVTTFSSCVLFAKALTGYSKPVGWAKNWPINSQEPQAGSVVVFSYNHVAVVTGVASDSINIVEANYIHGKESSRSLQFGDPTIRGYYVP